MCDYIYMGWGSAVVMSRHARSSRSLQGLAAGRRLTAQRFLLGDQGLEGTQDGCTTVARGACTEP